MAEIDDVLQRRPQQVLLTIVPWLRHRVPHADDPPPNRTNRRNRESQIAGKPLLNPPLLADSLTQARRSAALLNSLAVLHGRLDTAQIVKHAFWPRLNVFGS